MEFMEMILLMEILFKWVMLKDYTGNITPEAYHNAWRQEKVGQTSSTAITPSTDRLQGY
jgi:hypothetical protein